MSDWYLCETCDYPHRFEERPAHRGELPDMPGVTILTCQEWPELTEWTPEITAVFEHAEIEPRQLDELSMDELSTLYNYLESRWDVLNYQVQKGCTHPEYAQLMIFPGRYVTACVVCQMARSRIEDEKSE